MGRLCTNQPRKELPGADGFSLIELLIVVAIILIIAAIAIPNLLRARISANEASAASAVRSITRAEINYRAAYPTTGYASSLAMLGGGSASNCQPTATNACLIGTDLAAGQKSGYQFQATAALPSGGIYTAFIIGAVPVTFNGTGTRDFCAVNDGVVRGKSGAAGDTPTTDLTACAAFPPIN